MIGTCRECQWFMPGPVGGMHVCGVKGEVNRTFARAHHSCCVPRDPNRLNHEGDE